MGLKDKLKGLWPKTEKATPRRMGARVYNFETIPVGGFRDYGEWSKERANIIGSAIYVVKRPGRHPEMKFAQRKTKKGKGFVIRVYREK